MFEIGVRSDLSIAHSLKGEVFGPAQNLHGATYEVELAISADRLNNAGIVLDLGVAMQVLDSVLAKLNYRNLDEVETFDGMNTTTEYLARYICEEVIKQVAGKGNDISRVKVVLWETSRMWASYSRVIT